MKCKQFLWIIAEMEKTIKKTIYRMWDQILYRPLKSHYIHSAVTLLGTPVLLLINTVEPRGLLSSCCCSAAALAGCIRDLIWRSSVDNENEWMGTSRQLWKQEDLPAVLWLSATASLPLPFTPFVLIVMSIKGHSDWICCVESPAPPGWPLQTHSELLSENKREHHTQLKK